MKPILDMTTDLDLKSILRAGALASCGIALALAVSAAALAQSKPTTAQSGAARQTTTAKPVTTTRTAPDGSRNPNTVVDSAQSKTKPEAKKSTKLEGQKEKGKKAILEGKKHQQCLAECRKTSGYTPPPPASKQAAKSQSTGATKSDSGGSKSNPITDAPGQAVQGAQAAQAAGKKAQSDAVSIMQDIAAKKAYDACVAKSCK